MRDRNDSRAARGGLVPFTFVLFFGPFGLASEKATEQEVKAVFLYNFTKFVQWPKGELTIESAPIVIGVVGDDRFHALLEGVVAGELVGRRPLLARSLDRDEGLESCNMVFISASVAGASSILARARGESILTVGEAEGFTDAGGIIGFRIERHRVRFDINLEAARIARLQISSQLLKLADVVHAEP